MEIVSLQAFHRRVIEMMIISLSSVVPGDLRRTRQLYAETADWSSADLRFLHF
jgi:hypothetical protein